MWSVFNQNPWINITCSLLLLTRVLCYCALDVLIKNHNCPFLFHKPCIQCFSIQTDNSYTIYDKFYKILCLTTCIYIFTSTFLSIIKNWNFINMYIFEGYHVNNSLVEVWCRQCKSVEFVLSMLLKFRTSKKWSLKINTQVQRRHQRKDNFFINPRI